MARSRKDREPTITFTAWSNDLAVMPRNDCLDEGIVPEQGLAHRWRILFPAHGTSLDVREQKRNGTGGKISFRLCKRWFSMPVVSGTGG